MVRAFDCQLNAGRGIGTETCEALNVFLLMTSGLVQTLTRSVWLYMIYILMST